MAGHSRKWMILVATIWIQAFTGTNFDFSAYSSEMKAVLGISQVQLNYLATASDLGKLIGWSSGVALMCMPLPAVMIAAATMGFVGYGVQWLVLTDAISLPYFAVFLLCLLSGCSICWFNTVCFVLCIRNFPSNWPIALSLTLSFNGISPTLYNLAAASSSFSSSSTVYLLLNAFVPLFTSLVALLPITRQPPLSPPCLDTAKRNQFTFLKLNLLAVVTGLYLLLVSPSDPFAASLLFAGAILLLLLPLAIPGVIYAREWFQQAIDPCVANLHGSGFILVNNEELEMHRELLDRGGAGLENGLILCIDDDGGDRLGRDGFDEGCSCASIVEKDQLAMLGQEHDARMLVRRLDFWLDYLAYFCGGTIGLVYSNNLGQIGQSLGHGSRISNLITVYSAFSFFGRLLSAVPDFVRTKFYFARTGWLAIGLVPMPIAFLILTTTISTEGVGIQAATALIGLSSGFIFAATVSITSELFGPESVGVNHNMVITNIPIGSLLYGFIAAMVYDSNAAKPLSSSSSSSSVVSSNNNNSNSTLVCMGRECYFSTFVWWGCLSVLGLASSVLLFFRTRPAYCRFERSRRSMLMA